MSVILETRIQRFIGLSTDVKPTGVPDGSYFWCYDTNILWKTYDGTNWVTHTVKSITRRDDELPPGRSRLPPLYLRGRRGAYRKLHVDKHCEPRGRTSRLYRNIRPDRSCDSDHSRCGRGRGSCSTISREGIYLLNAVCSLCGAAYQLLSYRSHD
jgi:hypothetical protein